MLVERWKEISWVWIQRNQWWWSKKKLLKDARNQLQMFRRGRKIVKLVKFSLMSIGSTYKPTMYCSYLFHLATVIYLSSFRCGFISLFSSFNPNLLLSTAYYLD